MTRGLPGRQRGAALFIVMIMLIVMAWFGVSAFRMSSQNLQIVDNGQTRQQATAAAQRAIEATISNNLFALDPPAVAASPITSDVDGDGNADFTARLTPVPACYRKHTVKTAELNVADAKDRVCLQSSGAGGSVMVDRTGATNRAGDSLCANTSWHITAQVDDPRTNTSLAVHQGVSIRVAEVDAANYCR